LAFTYLSVFPEKKTVTVMFEILLCNLRTNVCLNIHFAFETLIDIEEC